LIYEEDVVFGGSAERPTVRVDLTDGGSGKPEAKSSDLCTGVRNSQWFCKKKLRRVIARTRGWI
jgi:hypothetical protein